MEEEQVQATEEGTTTVDNSKVIAETNAAAERLERANADMKATIQVQKAMQVEQSLGGTAEAGKPHVETDAEYAEKALGGDLNVNES
jgi:hypothetical protein